MLALLALAIDLRIMWAPILSQRICLLDAVGAVLDVKNQFPGQVKKHTRSRKLCDACVSGLMVE